MIEALFLGQWGRVLGTPRRTLLLLPRSNFSLQVQLGPTHTHSGYLCTFVWTIFDGPTVVHRRHQGSKEVAPWDYFGLLSYHYWDRAY